MHQNSEKIIDFMSIFFQVLDKKYKPHAGPIF